MLRLVGELDDYKGHWRRVTEVRTERLAQLRQVTTIESAASSTRIEGAESSDAEVARVREGCTWTRSGRTTTRKSAATESLLALTYDSHIEIPLTENHLKQLHGVLLRHSHKDERHRSEYKKLSNDVVATHPVLLMAAHGQRKGRFYTPATTEPTAAPPRPEAGTNAILAEMYQRGGRIVWRDLRALVKKYG